ncbi:uncharacterized protein LOC112271026 [Brachypodium distachyon]|uniref:uncharacterized protein LOC112271026 n=1 Tax=Brachypodium distachyon TaxID=15368 RepID=UPI000D0DD612|nr:uncharacterized protein LOC112271026 [Brachypodium distachyon]|eukprot:XP_024315682.1 uncharacterized protein LOC112271026 [Brachypodium distachyon]
MVDKVANKFQTWSAPMLTLGGWLTLVRSTLLAMPVYAMMFLDLPMKTIAGIEKICRGFLWKGRKDVRGGHCLVAWKDVCCLREIVGLGIPNLKLLNLALRTRWGWLCRADPTRPWAEFNIQIPEHARALCEAAIEVARGNGEALHFWYDPWLSEGSSLADLAPTLVSEISGRAFRLSVAEALHANGWLRAIHLELSFQALVDLLVVHDRVAEVILSDDDDRFRWKWSDNGAHTASSAYAAFFRGRVLATGATEVWFSKAPTKCKTFMWLVLKNRCWTADRLSKRGLPHPARCPLCDQSDKTIDHLLLGCVVAREVWSTSLRGWNRLCWLPTPQASLAEWWTSLVVQGKKEKRNLNTSITLICWCLWKHRNSVVFDAASPSA